MKKYKPIIYWINEDNDILSKCDISSKEDPLFTIEFGSFLTDFFFKIKIYGISESNEKITLTEGETIFSHPIGAFLEVGTHKIYAEYRPSKNESINFSKAYGY